MTTCKIGVSMFGPIATILAAKLMLEHLGENEAANKLKKNGV